MNYKYNTQKSILRFSKMSSLGLIIGRFQPLHKGHILLIEKSLNENPVTLVLVGSVNKDDEKNPYEYEQRKEFILGEFPDAKLSIAPLPDFPEDADWIDHILQRIPERVTGLTLYCGDRENDYAVQVLERHQETLPFNLNIVEIDRNNLPISGTQVREDLEQNNTEKLRNSLGKQTFEKLKKC